MRKKRKLASYFVWSIIASITAVILAMNLIYRITATIVTNEQYIGYANSEEGRIVLVSVVIGYNVLMLGIFITVFIVLVNRKVKYIKYISSEVKKIEKSGFGQVMEVRGKDELSELSEGINTMSVKLKEKVDQEKQIEKAKNELITNVSHDLRTPLTSIIGYVSLLKQNEFKDKEKFEEYISVIERRLHGLNLMINELFEYTKLNASEIKLNITTIDIIAVLQHLVYEYTIIYEKNGLQLEAQLDLDHCLIEADLEKIVRVFQNLLDNAKKYAVEASVIKLHAYKNEGALAITLMNKTKELRAEEIDTIFERFYKGDMARTETNSSGLGLSIVKRIVELHQGDITATMKEDQICFLLQLPLTRS
ncbi:MAG: HAMP domain-containing sensor histidine kinase [bacterium]|nr:HAMP domain-containing sensor histidine kinase [bacterium]